MLLYDVNPYLLYVFPVVLFITSGRGVRILIWLHCVISTYDMITSLAMRLSWYLYVALLSRLYLGRQLSELINNRAPDLWERQGGYFLLLFHLPFFLQAGYSSF